MPTLLSEGPNISNTRNERIDSQASPPTNEEFNDLLTRINYLLQEKRGGIPNSQPSNRASLPYFAEHIPISNELHKKALEGRFVDLNQLAPSTEESEPAMSAPIPELQSKKKRFITSFQSWLSAWNTYEALLVQSIPSVYKQCAEYRHFILDCSSKYVWNAVSQFDIKHRIKLAAHQSFDFGSIDHTLFIITFDSSTIKKKGVCFRCKGSDHFVGNCPFQEEKKDQISKTSPFNQPTSYHQGKEICNKFQSAQCLYPQCKRAHVCRNCRGPMPFSRCNVCQPQI